MLRSRIKFFLAASLTASVLTISSCSKIDEFGNMNTNPTVPLTPLTPALLTQVLSNVGNNYVWDQGGVSTVSGLYCQYFAETQYTEASLYAKPTTNWDGYYANNLKDLQTIIDYNTDETTAPIAAAYGSNANQIATARILKAYIMWFLTDTWGDIPYDGIFNAEANGVIPYTSQETIYNSLLSELTEAVAQFDSGDPMNGDILFDGDIDMWKKFANSLHAIMALRLSKVNPTLGSAEFNAALNADGGVFEADENAVVAYPGGNFNNPVYNYYNVTSRRDYAVTEYMVDWLYNNADDRVYSYANSLTGFPYGLTRDDAVDFLNGHPTFARVMGGGYTKSFNAATSEAFLLTASEVYIARSEAAYLGWTSEDVSDNYYNSIIEGWKIWDVYDEFWYENYVSQDQIALGTETGDDYEKICRQEWISHYPKGWLGWADWRRTGFPELEKAPGTTAPEIPTRFPYGPNEYSLNPTNVAEAASQYSGGGQSTDSQFGRLWWDTE